MIVARENSSKSMREAIAADVERVIVAHENKSESLRGSRSAADAVKIVIVAREN